MLDRDTQARQLTAVMEWELAPMLGESMSLADIDRALEELSSRFNSLLAEASANPAEDYTERFRKLSESTARLKERKAQLEGACQEQGRLQNRLRVVSAAMEHMTGRSSSMWHSQKGGSLHEDLRYRRHPREF